MYQPDWAASLVAAAAVAEAVDLHTDIVQSTLTHFGFFHRNVQQSIVRTECMVECELFETLLVFGEMFPPYIPQFHPQPKCIA